MSSLSLLEEKIKSADKIAVFSHINPDGDALGSTIAVKNVLKKHYGKDSDAVVIGKYPDIYDFMPLKNELILAPDFNNDTVYDLVITVDVASLERISQVEKAYNNSKFKVNIDHHKTNINYGDLNFVDGDASSTGEILYQIFDDLKITIDEDTAIALYASILTDTGCFKYKNTTEQSMIICSKLLAKGVDPSDISQRIYGNKPKPMVMLTAWAVSSAKFLNNDKLVYATVSVKDLEKFNAEPDHTEGIVEALREISSVKVAILFKELKYGDTKISMRSKDIDIAKICEKFGGGGHTNAAGCTIKKPLKIAVDKILEEFKDIK